MQQKTDELIRDLDSLLDEEREILLTGDLSQLEPLLKRKEALISALNNSEPERSEELVRTSEKTVRNQALLQEALAGIREVAKKLSDARQSKRFFETYDRQGQRTKVAAEGESSVEKRA